MPNPDMPYDYHMSKPPRGLGCMVGPPTSIIYTRLSYILFRQGDLFDSLLPSPDSDRTQRCVSPRALSLPYN